MLLDAEEDAACARFHSGTVLLDIRSAGFAHSSDLHQGSLARLAEIVEMGLNAFSKRGCSLLASSAKLHDVPSACLYDSETYWPNDEDTESIGTHTAKSQINLSLFQINLSLFNEMGPRADHDLRHGKRIAIAEKSNTKRLPAKR